MKENLKRLWVLLPMLALMGCPGGYGYKYNKGSFPSAPVNFTEMNTEYDDYNATAPTLGESVPLCFSSNRNSRGEEFDLVYKPFNIVFSKTTGELYIGSDVHGWSEHMLMNSKLHNAVGTVNSPGDELGPFLVLQDRSSINSDEYYNSFVMLYSSNETGNQDIYFTHNSNKPEYEDPLPVSFLNSEDDDAYPCPDPERKAIYFCSDREGGFDIYRASTNPEHSILEILGSDEETVIIKDTVLSSDWDDKCPFIPYGWYDYSMEEFDNNILVFASNREGGFGGFDLYYSLLEEGEWTAPVNFGAGINTEYDEYRPIVRPQYDFTNDFMIFSSNRPGGLGGFDLYYVGIPDIGYPW